MKLVQIFQFIFKVQLVYNVKKESLIKKFVISTVLQFFLLSCKWYTTSAKKISVSLRASMHSVSFHSGFLSGKLCLTNPIFNIEVGSKFWRSFKVYFMVEFKYRCIANSFFKMDFFDYICFILASTFWYL